MQRVYQGTHIPTRRHRGVELSLHRQVCNYLRSEFPSVLFRTDGGGLPLSQTQAGIFKSLQHGPGFPDLAVYQPSRGYHGLFLELKKEGTAIYVTKGPRKGQIVSNPHIVAQGAVLDRLNRLGYFARFACGFDQAVKMIDWYLEKPANLEMF